MVATAELQQKQLEQAEELFFSGPQKAGFAKELYLGKFRAESILPYPQLSAEQEAKGDEAVARVRKFAEQHIDADRIDREADIPPEVIRGLGDVGVLGMTVAPQHGGQGLSQFNYCRVMEVIGGHCGSTAVFVNAHHSIGLRALELFGTDEQKERWMRPLAAGEQLAAFALTEPQAGSDAANVQTRATPTDDGSGFTLDGEKRYITNGGIADVLTVMARTPDEHDPDGKITAFLVTPDMPGFEVVEARMEKRTIRGTATGKLAFHNMFIPKENVLGPFGKGLRVALTVLDFGRTTFGASCTGAAKYCLGRMVERARTRRQFGRAIGEFELVKEKIAHAAADVFAMESATYHTAALIDAGAEDFMLETAMLKVFASDALWRIVNDTIQVFGGAGFFTDEPFERMMRDARLNLVGEGANDVLRSFIAMYGLRGLGKQLEGVAKKPWTALKLVTPSPRVPVVPRRSESLAQHARLQDSAAMIGRQIGKFARSCRNTLIRHREGVLDRQLIQARLGDAATDLFLMSCVYSRLSLVTTQLTGGSHDDEQSRLRDLEAGHFFLRAGYDRNRRRLRALKQNIDEEQNRAADAWLNKDAPS